MNGTGTRRNINLVSNLPLSSTLFGRRSESVTSAALSLPVSVITGADTGRAVEFVVDVSVRQKKSLCIFLFFCF